MKGIITEIEKSIAKYCIERAQAHGAQAARVSLSKSIMDSVTMLDGEVDKVTHCADRSVFIYLFADGRYGTFSTNRLDEKDLDGFIAKAVDTVKMLAPDKCRRLPDIARTASDAKEGDELELYDISYAEVTADRRLETARSCSIYKDVKNSEEGYSLISEECEYSDGIDDNYLIDSQGFEGRHIETSYSCCCEVTIADEEGSRLSGYWWESSPLMSTLETSSCSRTALSKAVAQIGPKPSRSGKRKMIVDRSVSSRLIGPLISALDSNAIQQKNSFLSDALGKEIFHKGLTLMDMAHSKGESGSRLFDTEGVATEERAIIEGGIVKTNYTSTYASLKTGKEPTCEGVSRPVLLPFVPEESLGGKIVLEKGEKEVNLKDILAICRNGIYVTGFNGGNCNPVTGDFSYGIEGFAFKDGRITHPVREMLITGNMIQLWNDLIAAGSDSRKCSRWRIPTLAFKDVSFSA